jgi:hypothetical protein
VCDPSAEFFFTKGCQKHAATLTRLVTVGSIEEKNPFHRDCGQFDYREPCFDTAG